MGLTNHKPLTTNFVTFDRPFNGKSLSSDKLYGNFLCSVDLPSKDLTKIKYLIALDL